MVVSQFDVLAMENIMCYCVLFLSKLSSPNAGQRWKTDSRRAVKNTGLVISRSKVVTKSMPCLRQHGMDDLGTLGPTNYLRPTNGYTTGGRGLPASDANIKTVWIYEIHKRGNSGSAATSTVQRQAGRGLTQKWRTSLINQHQQRLHAGPRLRMLTRSAT